MTSELVPLGEHAWLARFADESHAAGWAEAVRHLDLPGVTDVVLAYRTAAVYASPDRADFDAIEARLRAVRYEPVLARTGLLHRVPVLYDGEDLQYVAERLQTHAEAIVASHANREYRVFAIGFLPGFPYAGYLGDDLAGLARRQSPRARVPAGAVAIVGRQTGIYPQDSPGGWHLIGRTPLRIVDVERGYFPIRAGDRLLFEPIESAEFEARRGEHL